MAGNEHARSVPGWWARTAPSLTLVMFIHTRLARRRACRAVIPVLPPLKRGHLHSIPHRDGSSPLSTMKKKVHRKKKPHGKTGACFLGMPCKVREP